MEESVLRHLYLTAGLSAKQIADRLGMPEAKRFWANETGLPESQIKLNTYQAVHNYRAKSKYGTATVGVNNIKLRALMENWLNEMYNRLK